MSADQHSETGTGLPDEPGSSTAGEGHQPAATTPPETQNMLPARAGRRSRFERLVVRLIATCGVVGIGVAIAAIMVSSKSQGWIVGLVVSIVSVVLSGVLWSSQRL